MIEFVRTKTGARAVFFGVLIIVAGARTVPAISAVFGPCGGVASLSVPGASHVVH